MEWGSLYLLWGPHLCPLGFALSPLARLRCVWSLQWPALASCRSRNQALKVEAVSQTQLSAGGTRVLLRRWGRQVDGQQLGESCLEGSIVDFSGDLK